jgi:release factor glutamine methyltransferase
MSSVDRDESAAVVAQAGTHIPETPSSVSPLARGRAEISLGALRQEVTRSFRRANLDTPELDARLLIAHGLHLDHAALNAQRNRRLTVSEVDVIAALAERRLKRDPVARIVGSKEFWSLSLRLNAETLVPRAETETMIEAALAALGDRARPLCIADLGTGSGAILLALLSELPAAFGIGTDISESALACARANAAALALAGRAAFVACDYGAAIAGPIDVLVSNPPYIARAEIAALQPEVKAYDPRRALDGGRDGLDGYRAIAADARRLLAAEGILVVELGQGQEGAVNSLFANAGLKSVAPARRDLAGCARALVMRLVP